jgi:hypothetical protein
VAPKLRLDVQEIHQSVVFDTSEAGDAAVCLGDKDSSNAKAVGPLLHVRRFGSPGRDLFPCVISGANLAHGPTKAGHHPFKVAVRVRADHGGSPDAERSA